MSEVPIRPTLYLRLLIPAISPADQYISVGTEEVGVSKNRFLSQAKKERGGSELKESQCLPSRPAPPSGSSDPRQNFKDPSYHIQILSECFGPAHEPLASVRQ